MNAIALDTASDSLHLALQTDTAYASIVKSAGRRYSEELIPQMLTLCTEAGIKLADLNLIICANGPGSFTGLRIGMAAAKGIAMGAGIPLVSLSNLEVYHYPVRHIGIPIVSVLDAKKNRFYCAVFHNGSRLTPDTDSTPIEMCAKLNLYKKIFLTGPDAMIFAPKLREALTACAADTVVVVDDLKHRDYGEALLVLGTQLMRSRGPDEIGMGPTYIRKSEAELSLQERIAESLLAREQHD
ncbi:MAG: tRNA (adenosine(37)-N6)-threonylcarbamoyltransferase complex dimerization subunit type 1 TsaB [Spirochaetae bacterium HGW-Spirochaetae-8]|jgi:tRNA threonylcarbamoyladenosine biosynthesis protein TsaB|nr:MAG: tRNA (adenosine(37)-N6)-threonylcarbamoyltransferase complex dimerization subunit type 1 TsaB [Spirochaetae bacterium HGW-Spirochaetae-8]